MYLRLLRFSDFDEMGDQVGHSNFEIFESLGDVSYGVDDNNQDQSGMDNNDHYNRHHNQDQDQNQGGSSNQHYDDNQKHIRPWEK
jgi:hypothetical protein